MSRVDGKKQTGALAGEIRICEQCGKPYEPLEHNQRYCSIPCRNYKLRRAKTEKICPHCGIRYMGRKVQVFCSVKCQKGARLVMKGWGITKEKWFNLREYIIERDNFTCQDCGKFYFDKGLAVHHRLALYKGGNNNPSNLITLCEKCHLKRHSKRHPIMLPEPPQ